MMIEVTPWDKVFTEYKGTKKGIFTILYWYLFNKPDYLTNIASGMKKMEKSGAFENFPKVITRKNTIGESLHEMEKYNLIGRCGPDDLRKYDLIEEKIGKTRRVYFQALSFFYMDPFCIKTPNSQGKDKDINAHHEEYKKYIKDPRITQYPYPYRTVFSFDSLRNKPVVLAQKTIQKCSSRPEKFMKMISRGKRDHIVLYELIIKTFKEIEAVISLIGDMDLSECVGAPLKIEDPNTIFGKPLGTINGKKAFEMCKLYRQSIPKKAELMKRRYDIRRTRRGVRGLLNLYRKLERRSLSFNPKTWMFE